MCEDLEVPGELQGILNVGIPRAGRIEGRQGSSLLFMA